jgi:hypothetical protein
MFGAIFGVLFASPYVIIYLGGTGTLLFWIFSRCSYCKHSILEYYAWKSPLTQLTLFMEIILFLEIKCPYCSENNEREP